MNKTKRHLLSLALALILLAIHTMMVLAKELGSLTISGPGIEGEMSIDHEGGMMKLERTGFFDQASFMKPPEKPGEGYNITAYLNLDGKVVPFVQMVYYAAADDQPGYVHYTARLSGESLKPVDQWRQLNEDADIAFRGLMEEYKITLQPAIAAVEAAPVVNPAVEAEPAIVQPVVEPADAVPAATSAGATVPSGVMLAVTATLILLVGAGLVLRRRAISPQV